MKNLTVIVPCYNYETYILSSIEKLINKLEKYKIDFEIIIINDGSSDNTKKVESISNNQKINLINNYKNKGKFSIINALPLCKYENIILIDCDLSYFDYFDKVILGIKDNFDLICVNRRSKQSVLIDKDLSYYQKLDLHWETFRKLINSFKN